MAMWAGAGLEGMEDTDMELEVVMDSVMAADSPEETLEEV